MAEREGFEPPIPVKVYTLSRRAPSATRPSLRAAAGFQAILSGKLVPTRIPTPFIELNWPRISLALEYLTGHLICHFQDSGSRVCV
jgi:hypothetical protein